ncbi:MAG: DUF262 domain-containing protein [Hyphomicrobiaceae bacterium]|nr:MAG: DUF262 domain-containing protein [Hyphomicrobiaceae bacterium]
MPIQLRTAAMSLAKLLTYRERFAVPEYQRVYGWRETELDRLFSDLETAMRRHGRRGDLEPCFFLGTIYLAAADDKGEAQIADGQQRILTANMIYAVARDLAEDQSEADRLHALLLTPDGSGFRFAPRDRDGPFFRRWVQERGATLRPLLIDSAPHDGEADAAEHGLSESQLNIIRNRDSIIDKLIALGPEGRGRLLEFLAAGTSVVVITASTLDEARNAYASTQTRGLRQSETDKLKAELIGDCPETLRARLAGQWEECEAALGKDDFAEIFHHLIFIESERRPQHALEADLFRVFDLPHEIESFIDRTLVPCAQSYRRICTAGASAPRRLRRINGFLVSLLRTTHNTWKAPALLALCEFGEDPAALERFLRDLERLAAVLMIIGADPNKTIECYARVIHDIKRKTIAKGTALEIDAKDLARARECLEDRRFAMRERFRMPVLLKLNDLLGGEVEPIDPRQVSCEHILPRNPPRRGPWRAAFRRGDGAYEGGHYTHAIGNMAILTHTQNREADTSAFEVKRKILKGSGFALSKDAAKDKVWTPEVIRRRSGRMCALLFDYWRLRG